MKRLATSILALGLAATVGTASAQSSGYYSQYGQPTVDRYGQSSGSHYDYARVLRVDPVIQSDYGYGNTGAHSNGSQRCYTRNEGYASNDPYYNNGYGNNGYGNDGYYARDGYYRSSNGYGNDGYYGNNGYRGGNETSRTVATVVGGVIGAVVGSKVGGGSGRYVASALGTMAGGMAGRAIYDQSVRQRQRPASVTVCDPEPVRNGYGYSRVNDNRVAGYDVTYEYGGRSYRTRTDYHPGDRIRVRVDVRPE
ncbi:glycine zipper 2TM domain-containing protein [Luteimonas sp. SX5]|uniref:Glycine zipper 2TM domain-containing protein n=1 Tax=Luteimonas galliterrae TaxID=2940486 RepID=A0ABT0MJY7_9GAMM|nr:glycine zipper 2TM domain-containing protein [Luteimonas galliterrae]MCL1635190.1 glycine zipper 2TM domain-containing protein [Luteimonas galliterrae]